MENVTHKSGRRFRLRIPDALLLAANIAIMMISGGDGRIFLISLVIALVMRYLFLSALVFVDWIFPGRLGGPWLRRMVKDPSEGGAYEGGGATYTIFGHLLFLALFAGFALGYMEYFNKSIPLSGHINLLVAAAAAAALRDILVGRVVYFRSGAGQRENASWNFTLPLVLAFVTITLPVCLIFGGLLVLGVYAFLAGEAFSRETFDKILLWLTSVWVLAVFHYLLLFDKDIRSPDKNGGKCDGKDGGGGASC